jgi:hypothetical protein
MVRYLGAKIIEGLNNSFCRFSFQGIMAWNSGNEFAVNRFHLAMFLCFSHYKSAPSRHLPQFIARSVLGVNSQLSHDLG